MFTNASAASTTRIHPLYLILVSAVAIGIPPLYLLLAVALVASLTIGLMLVANRARIHRRGATRLEGAGAGALSGVLLSSRREHDVIGTTRWTLWSIVVHACVVVALLTATAWSHEAAADDVIYCFFPEPTPPLPPLPPLPPPPCLCTRYPPMDIPQDLPATPIAPTTMMSNMELDFSGFGVDGRAAGGKEAGRPVSDLDEAASWTPYTVSPLLQNTTEVQRVLMRAYPPLLRDAGVGGTVLLWLLVDETGSVVQTRVKESSGHPRLDEAAAGVAEVMEFLPARNGPWNVPVWVAIPILFDTR